jgi:predicted AAA+ superfamily ATPase
MAEPIHALYRRFAAARVATALHDTTVVMVIGPRQCGKTTSVRDFATDSPEFITMDDDRKQPFFVGSVKESPR